MDFARALSTSKKAVPTVPSPISPTFNSLVDTGHSLSPRGARENSERQAKKMSRRQRARGTRSFLASYFTWQQYAANRHGYSIVGTLVAIAGDGVNPDHANIRREGIA